ncbi:MAG: rhodanese-like domain-containing protein [Candidatus Nanopelagicales bacterium]|nr:rhodanese-like domain-containing protein [Candidatus Nanopelagicales bacterium]
MKKVTTLTVAAISAIAMLTGCSSTNEAIKKVDPVKFSEVIAQPGVIILDVRTPEEFNAGHIANAININLEGSDFSSEVSKLDKNATVAVYCRSGNRSGVATDQMAEIGFTDMYDMQGGIVDWEAAGGPVVK